MENMGSNNLSGELTEQEREKILVEWNSTQGQFPADKCLHHLFEEHVINSPDAVAIIYKEQSWTYSQIEHKANQLAHHLVSLGAKPEILVGLCCERSVEMVIGILGILKAGAAYVPIDPNYPNDRIKFMLEDTRVSILLTQSQLNYDLPTTVTKVVLLDSDWSIIDKSPTSLFKSGVTVDNLCYVIYTSGSTGLPKGIELRHQGVVNNIVDLNTSFNIDHSARTIAISALGFDMCVYEVLGTLAAGGAIVMPDQKGLKDPMHWAELVVKHKVSVWNSAPALLEMFVDYVESHPNINAESIKVVIQGGDWEPVSLPDRLRKISPNAQVVVLGGATEASIHSIVFPVTKVNPDWKSIPYGKPMKNQTAYILDEALNPVAIGVAGELHLGGIGLARGYFARPELTAEKFIKHPFIENERIYKTGDLAKWMPDGNIELVGRIDFQVKIRGHRVELGEISAKLQLHEAVEQAVVMMREDKVGEQKLVAYIVSDGTLENELLVETLRNLLNAQLPDYMVPQFLVVLAQLPLTPNGKIDRNALPVPGQTHSGTASNFVAAVDNVQLVISDIWQEVLDVEKIGIKDNFLAIGGHSLKATQIVSRINELFTCSLTFHDFFRADTIEKLAATLTEIGKNNSIDIVGIADTIVEMNRMSDDELKALLAQ